MWNNYLPQSVTIHDVAFWVDGFGPADRKNARAYTFTDTSEGVYIFAGKEIVFDGVSAQVSLGDIGEDIKSIVMWVNPTNQTEYLIDLDGSINVNISASTVTATGWTSPTIYTNDEENPTIAEGVWSLVAVVSDTGIDANAVEIGVISTDFMTGSMTQIIGFTKALSQVEINQIWAHGLRPGVSTFLGTEAGDAILQEDGGFIIV